MTAIITGPDGRRYYWEGDEKRYIEDGGTDERCPVDGLRTYHTSWWCETLLKYPGFGQLVEEFELLLDAHTSSELDHIEDPDYDEVDRHTIGLVQRDAETRRTLFKDALMNLVVVTS